MTSRPMVATPTVAPTTPTIAPATGITRTVPTLTSTRTARSPLLLVREHGANAEKEGQYGDDAEKISRNGSNEEPEVDPKVS